MSYTVDKARDCPGWFVVGPGGRGHLIAQAYNQEAAERICRALELLDRVDAAGLDRTDVAKSADEIFDLRYAVARATRRLRHEAGLIPCGSPGNIKIRDTLIAIADELEGDK